MVFNVTPRYLMLHF